jgi:hypothetical protein
LLRKPILGNWLQHAPRCQIWSVNI